MKSLQILANLQAGLHVLAVAACLVLLGILIVASQKKAKGTAVVPGFVAVSVLVTFAAII